MTTLAISLAPRLIRQARENPAAPGSGPQAVADLRAAGDPRQTPSRTWPRTGRGGRGPDEVDASGGAPPAAGGRARCAGRTGMGEPVAPDGTVLSGGCGPVRSSAVSAATSES